MNGHSLHLRLIVTGAISIAIALTLSSLGLKVLFERHAERAIVAEMLVVIDTLAAGLDRTPDGRLYVAAPPRDSRYDVPLSGFYWQVGPEFGPALVRSRSSWDAEVAIPQDHVGEGEIHTHHISAPTGGELLMTERLITLPTRLGGNRLRVVVGRDAADLSRAGREFFLDLAPFLFLLGLLLLAASGAQVAIGLAPLKTIRSRVAAIRMGTVDRIGTNFPAEILPLATELDALLAHRERDVAAAHARAADLAHGLKTPLQVLSGEIERLHKLGMIDAVDALTAVGEAMRRHIERELSRVRLANRRGETITNVRNVAESIVRVLKMTPLGDRLEWSVDISANIIAVVHADDLADALGAILENAAKFAKSRVRLTAESEGKTTKIIVVDDGPGIPADMRIDMLRRGRRLDEAGPGSGLGLSIAREILEGSGGHLSLGPTGSGNMTVTLSLPAQLTDC